MTSRAHRVTDQRARSRNRLSAVIIPLGVAFATLALLAWSAWPVVRPARNVAVVQAVVDRTASPSSEPSPTPKVPDVPIVQAPGWLEAEPFAVAAAALADGVIESIHVLEGDYVEQGDVVAELVREDSELRLRLAEAELAAAESLLASARAERHAAERAWSEPVALERAVETGRASLTEAEAVLAQLPALITAARARRTELTEVADRVRQSTERGATNEIELIVAEQQAEAQRAETAALEARRPILEARVVRLSAELRATERDLELRIEDRRRLDTANAAVAKAEANTARALAARDEAILELDRMVIRSPISGYVQERHKLPGDKAITMMDDPESAHIVHLYDPSRIQVRVDVPLADASHIFVGQSCEVVVDVLPDRAFRGEVLRITHQADLQKNTLQAKVKVLDPEPILRPEMLTRVKFLPPERSDASVSRGSSASASRVLVPTASIDESNGSPRVWLVTQRRNDRGVLSSRLVDVIEHDAEWLAVAGDIQPGALLAVGLDKPREGEAVVIRRAIQEGAGS